MEEPKELSLDQRIFLLNALEMWNKDSSDFGFIKSFRVLQKVLETNTYYVIQKTYIENIRHWYLHNKRLDNKNMITKC